MSQPRNLTIFNLLTITAMVAFGCLTLFNESIWLTSTLTTVLIGLTLHGLIACAVCRGEKQAFGIGYIIATLLFYVSFNSFDISKPLPYLLTEIAWEMIEDTSTGQEISEGHFFIVATQLWWFLCAYFGGLLARRQHNQRVRSVVAST